MPHSFRSFRLKESNCQTLYPALKARKNKAQGSRARFARSSTLGFVFPRLWRSGLRQNYAPLGETPAFPGAEQIVLAKTIAEWRNTEFTAFIIGDW
jgi:hypothetical protein